MSAPAYLPAEIKEAIIQVCGRSFFYKGVLFGVFARAGIPQRIYEAYEPDAKFVIARKVLNDLEQMGEEGMILQRRLVTELHKFRTLPDPAADRDNGLEALQAFKKLAIAHDLAVGEEKRAVSTRIATAEMVSRRAVERSGQLKKLSESFSTLSVMADRSTAGLQFEQLLNALFNLFGLAPRQPFRVVGEQIDGSFLLDYETYLLEARWTQKRIQESDLLVFRGKIEGKSAFTRGVFISVNGYTQHAVEAISKGKQPLFFLMDGLHVTLVLEGRIELTELLRTMLRRLTEEGQVYVSPQELF